MWVLVPVALTLCWNALHVYSYASEPFKGSPGKVNTVGDEATSGASFLSFEASKTVNLPNDRKAPYAAAIGHASTLIRRVPQSGFGSMFKSGSGSKGSGSKGMGSKSSGGLGGWGSFFGMSTSSTLKNFPAVVIHGGGDMPVQEFCTKVYSSMFPSVMALAAQAKASPTQTATVSLNFPGPNRTKNAKGECAPYMFSGSWLGSAKGTTSPIIVVSGGYPSSNPDECKDATLRLSSSVSSAFSSVSAARSALATITTGTDSSSTTTERATVTVYGGACMTPGRYSSGTIPGIYPKISTASSSTATQTTSSSTGPQATTESSPFPPSPFFTSSFPPSPFFESSFPPSPPPVWPFVPSSSSSSSSSIPSPSSSPSSSPKSSPKSSPLWPFFVPKATTSSSSKSIASSSSSSSLAPLWPFFVPKATSSSSKTTASDSSSSSPAPLWPFFVPKATSSSSKTTASESSSSSPAPLWPFFAPKAPAPRPSPPKSSPPIPSSSQAAPKPQGPVDSLDVETLNEPTVCRQYPDIVTNDWLHVVTLEQSTKLTVNCWTIASLPGEMGSIRGSNIWLRDQTQNCWLHEQLLAKPIRDIPRALQYCNTPQHLVAGLQPHYSRQDCYEGPSLSAPSKDLGTGTYMDVKCKIYGESIRGNATWIKTTQDCYMPGGVFDDEKWYGGSSLDRC